ncbi:hypothetical protein TIFTF001_003680 [Ficus carica]|uniref:Uncharacterized protein n=1 Tax=Ficus carica TaxID=3494 RepID=A0AA87ZCP8_FICCA|nr:hypothetical protein TIFTF001_003680 [Ficus carica]
MKRGDLSLPWERGRREWHDDMTILTNSGNVGLGWLWTSCKVEPIDQIRGRLFPTTTATRDM